MAAIEQRHEFKKFKFLATVEKGRLPSSDVDVTDRDLAPYLTMDYLRGESDTPVLVAYDASSCVMADEGDLLLVWDGNAGEFLLAKRGVVSSTTALVTPREVDRRYLYWACKSQEHALQSEAVGMAIPHVDGERLANLRVPVPELSRQRTIADYLDRETARIDALIAAKERMVELLAEKHCALIVRALTCGLAPNVTMRKSGIPWLKKIPAHWETPKLGHIGIVGNGATPRRGNARFWGDGTIPWLNSAVVNQEEVTSTEQYVTEMAVRECHLPLLHLGTVLIAISGQGKTRGRAVVLSMHATINQHLAFVVPDRERLDAWFLRWCIFAAYGFLRNISENNGGTRGALTCEDVTNLRIPMPPLQEQKQIVSFIARKAAQLRIAQGTVELAAALLRERRFAVVARAIDKRFDMEKVT